MLSPLVSVAYVKRLATPFQHLVVEAQPAKHLRELLFQHLLAPMLAAAGRGLASALIGIAGAVLGEVFLLLDLADHRAAALGIGDQP